jgi:PIN domain nuclease of toxin-antitoxin system
VTVILDAFAVIAALVGEPAAAEVEKELRRRNADVRISAVNLAEVVDQLVRQAHFDENVVDTALESLIAGGLVVTPADWTIGRLAGQLRARHYHKSAAAISLADCVALGTSLILGATLGTADPALTTVARRVGVRVLPLPDSRGRRPDSSGSGP